MTKLWPVFVVVLLAGCHRASVRPEVHYTLGAPYEADGAWHYPRLNFAYDETGIASVEQSPKSTLTTDGEVYSPRAYAAAHPTLELPAIARVTNLENGEQVVVRINERGPADPGRIIALTPIAARALGFHGKETARVRVRVLPEPSERLALSLPGGPRIAVAKAPVGVVRIASLAPLPGAKTDSFTLPVTPRETPGEAPREAAPNPPADRPGTRSRVAPSPGEIFVRAGLFTEAKYASLEAERLARLSARAVPARGAGGFAYEVRIGPFSAVPEADAVLKEVLAQGFGGARLVVE